MRSIPVAALFVAILPSIAFGGPVRDFENGIRVAYGDYRAALFQTNTGNADKSRAALASFSAKWSRLSLEHVGPPPQYADDPDYAKTVSSIAAIAEAAAKDVEAGALPKAHETLEAIRDEIGALHERNGIVSFSDRMNAYHAKMEEILGKDYAAQPGMLREDAAILSFLAQDIASHPPNEAGDPEYDRLRNGMIAATGALLDGSRSADATIIKNAMDGLKGPYSRFFLKFG